MTVEVRPYTEPYYFMVTSADSIRGKGRQEYWARTRQGDPNSRVEVVILMEVVGKY
jgi:hypothetical protein